MAQITKITAQKRRGRYNIFLDGQYAFPVSETTLVTYHLAKEMTLTEDMIAQIKVSEVVAMGLEIGLNYHASKLEPVKKFGNGWRKNNCQKM